MGLYKVDKNTGDTTLVAGGTLYADLPIGSWIKNNMDTLPLGFLKVGDTISQSEYPELYAKYGSTVPYKADTSELDSYSTSVAYGTLSSSSGYTMLYDGFMEIRVQGTSGQTSPVAKLTVNNSTVMQCGNYNDGSRNTQLFFFRKGDVIKITDAVNSSFECKIAYYKKSLIVKAKHASVPTDFADSLIGYLGKETNYNLYPWSHARTAESPDDNQDITIERDGWYSIDYTLSSGTDTTHTFTFRDFDSQGEVHTIMRSVYDKSGTFRQTFLVPLKAGHYRYSHGGIGTLSVYMNRRDFA